MEMTNLELLMLLLQQVESTDAHHVSGHHIRQHIRETERGHFVMMATSGSAELLKTLQLSLGLGKVSRNAIVDLNGSCASVCGKRLKHRSSTQWWWHLLILQLLSAREAFLE